MACHHHLAFRKKKLLEQKAPGIHEARYVIAIRMDGTGAAHHIEVGEKHTRIAAPEAFVHEFHRKIIPGLRDKHTDIFLVVPASRVPDDYLPVYPVIILEPGNDRKVYVQKVIRRYPGNAFHAGRVIHGTLQPRTPTF